MSKAPPVPPQQQAAGRSPPQADEAVRRTADVRAAGRPDRSSMNAGRNSGQYRKVQDR